MKLTTSNVAWCQQARLIILGQLIIITMLDMSDPYWPLILASFHPFTARTLQYWSGAIYMAPLLTTIFTTLLWTKLGERIGYKKMILRAGFALAATQGALFFFNNPWLILFIRLLQGALAGFTAAAQAWSLQITPIHVHSQIVGRLQSATAMGSIIGPILGGTLANYYGYLSIFIVSGCVCLLLSSLLAHFLKENIAKAQIAEFKVKRIINKLKPCENLLFVLICFTQAARWMSAPFFALYVVEQLQAGNIILGIIYAVMALTMSLTTPNLGRIIDRQSNHFFWSKQFLILALLLSGLVQCGFAFTTKAYLALILSVFWGISLGVISLVLFTFLLKGINDDRRSKMVGLGNTALKIGNLLGIILGTMVQAEARFMISFMVIGFFYFVLAILAGCYEQAKGD
jgi:MFS family permease